MKMSTELQQVNNTSPLAMAAEFIKKDSNVDIDKLSQFFDLHERWEKNQAKKAYVEAMAAFKANPPKVCKDKHVEYNKTKYSHASLANVTSTINEALSKHGLTASWTTVQGENNVTVTCIITHIFGHSEQTSLSSAPDNSGSKNPIQAIGSAVSYLQRYTLLSLVGIATEDMDDDGAGTDDKKEPEKVVWTDKQKAVADKLKISLQDAFGVENLNLEIVKGYLVWHYSQQGLPVTEDDKEIKGLVDFILKKPNYIKRLKGEAA
jgi:hypothetical protein